MLDIQEALSSKITAIWAKFLTTVRVADQDLFLRETVQPQHIWIVEVADGKERRLTNGNWSLEFVLPPGSL